MAETKVTYEKDFEKANNIAMINSNEEVDEDSMVLKAADVSVNKIIDYDADKDVTAQDLVDRINEMQTIMSDISNPDMDIKKFTGLIENVANKKDLFVGILDFEYKQEILKKEVDETSYANCIIMDEMYRIITETIDIECTTSKEYLYRDTSIISLCRWVFWFINDGYILNNNEEVKAASTIGIIESLATVYSHGYQNSNSRTETYFTQFSELCKAVAKNDITLTNIYISASTALATDQKYQFSNVFDIMFNRAVEAVVNTSGIPGFLFEITHA